MRSRSQEQFQIPKDEIESVSEFTRKIKHLLETELRGGWIRGEVSNLRRQHSGHVYFSLKDVGSQISAVMFRGDVSRQRVELEDGMQVVVFGEISVYEPRGNYQLIVRMAVEDGAGHLQQEFEKLKSKLDAEGLFDADQKKEIPSFPKAIGIVTSPTGAAVQDFIRILKRREWIGQIVVLPAKVQGVGAAEEIAEMIRFAQTMSGLELLVVGRGGGSLEDLWCFNEEIVVRAIAESEIPIISAVGHEIDFTLSDFTADVRAETPSAAAEIISSSYLELWDRYQTARQNLEYYVDEGLSKCRDELSILGNRFVQASPKTQLEQCFLKLDELHGRFNQAYSVALAEKQKYLHELQLKFQQCDPGNELQMATAKINNLENNLEWKFSTKMNAVRSRIQQATALFNSLNPESVLNRGYAILRNEHGVPVSSVKSLSSGDKMKAELKDGELDMIVE